MVADYVVQIASVSEYVANATGDLVLLGLWHVATDAVKGDAIPFYYFARDNRITKSVETARLVCASLTPALIAGRWRSGSRR